MGLLEHGFINHFLGTECFMFVLLEELCQREVCYLNLSVSHVSQERIKDSETMLNPHET